MVLKNINRISLFYIHLIFINHSRVIKIESPEELKEILSGNNAEGFAIPDAELKRIIEEVDVDKDGMLQGPNLRLLRDVLVHAEGVGVDSYAFPDAVGHLSARPTPFWPTSATATPFGKSPPHPPQFPIRHPPLPPSPLPVLNLLP